MENTKAFYLTEGRKNTWFDCHRRWLGPEHTFRRNVTGFIKNCVELDCPPRRLFGEEAWDRVSFIPKVYEAGSFRLDGYGREHNWTKQSIFWELPYWKDNLLCHNLDVMHIEKNVCDNVLYTLLNEVGKSKDNLSARKDLEHLGVRPELWPDANGKFKSACFTMTNSQKDVFFQTLKEVTMPDGYASNISRCMT